MEGKENIESKSLLYPEISKEILAMAKVDQETQMTKESDEQKADRLKEVYKTNTERMKHIVKQIGWPTVSKVGSEASDDAWLLVQHADHDVAFQKECLDLMKKESQEEVSEEDIAYLHDRICVNEGRPQFYGTQFTTNEYGAYGPEPIENIELVDERRAEIGLKPLAEYKDELVKKYNLKG